MATLRTSTSNTETAVLYSRGPDKDPFSMYSTTNSVLHDLKKPLSAAPALKPPMEMGGFARNNLPTAAKEAPDVPNPRTLGRTFNRLIDDPTAPVHSQSLSAASFAMGSTTLGERNATEQQFGFLRSGGFNGSLGGTQRSIRSADTALAAGGLGLDEVDGADIVAAIATQRAKRSGTGFTTNTVKPTPTAQDQDDVTHLGATTMLAKAVRGRTDPLARENDFKGPAPMSTTQRASFVPHPDVDPGLLEPGAFLDLEARRVATCGSLKNRAPTLHHQPHDGWRPSTESRDAYVRPDLASDPHETITRATLAKRKSIPKHRSVQSAVPPVGDEFADDPTQLTYLQEQKLKHSDPIGYDVYMRQDPWVTTSRATHDGRPDPNRTTVDDVMATNATARRVLNASIGSNGALDRGLLVSTLSGAPHKKPASGFATNNASDPPHEPSEFNNPQKLSVHQTATARVSRRLENEGDIQMSIYQSQFRDQLRLPPPAGQFRELRKYTSGFERCNKDNMFASDEGTEDPERWKRKV